MGPGRAYRLGGDFKAIIWEDGGWGGGGGGGKPQRDGTIFME